VRREKEAQAIELASQSYRQKSRQVIDRLKTDKQVETRSMSANTRADRAVP
jgi:hypothetical protein